MYSVDIANVRCPTYILITAPTNEAAALRHTMLLGCSVSTSAKCATEHLDPATCLHVYMSSVDTITSAMVSHF